MTFLSIGGSCGNLSRGSFETQPPRKKKGRRCRDAARASASQREGGSLQVQREGGSLQVQREGGSLQVQREGGSRQVLNIIPTTTTTTTIL